MSCPSFGDVSSHDNHYLDQVLANPRGKSGPLPVFAGKVLLEHPLVYILSLVAFAL